MKPILLRAIIIISVSIFIFLLTFLPLYFAGYVANMIWNYYAVQTNCLITNHSVLPDTCSYSCNCYQSCTTNSKGSQTCTQICQTCYYTCYDGYVTFRYQDENNNTYTPQVEVVSGYDYSSDVNNYLNTYYPLDINVICYYNTRNPSDFKLKEDNPRGYYIAALFMASVCVAIIVIWLLVELILVIKRNKQNIEDFVQDLKDRFCCDCNIKCCPV